MKLNFDDSIIGDYHSASQIARVMTERWALENMYCPQCGNLHIEHFENQNNNIRAKIRQQLQFLKDRGFIEFLGDGKYKKTAI